MTYLFLEFVFPDIEFQLDGYRKDYSVREVATRRTRKIHKVSHRKNRLSAYRFTRHERNWAKQRCSITDLKIKTAKRKMDKYYRMVKHG